MRIGELKEAIAEAERFLRAAKKARDAYGRNEYGNLGFYNQSFTAATKRASMDLSKALSALRTRT